MTIEELQDQAWRSAEEKGFHSDLNGIDQRRALLVRLCLLHTEVSEAAQVVKRKWGPIGSAQRSAAEGELALELADVAIRLGDLAETAGINLSDAVDVKMQQNRQRPHLYGTPGEGGI